MSRRFQFSTRDLLGLLTLAAVVAWGATLVGVVGIAIGLLFVSPLLVGALLRKPVEGCLANAFMLIVLAFGGFVAIGIAGLFGKFR